MRRARTTVVKIEAYISSPHFSGADYQREEAKIIKVNRNRTEIEPKPVHEPSEIACTAGRT